MKPLYTLFILCIAIQLSFAQSSATVTPGIYGVIEDSQGPISFATVILVSETEGSMVKAAYTEDDGSFILPNVNSGNYFIEITYVGYNDYKSDLISYSEGAVFNVPEISLVSASQQIEEVVVTAKRPMIEIKPDRTVFNVEGSTNAQGENGLTLLRKAPGVVVDNNNNIQLLGKNGVQVYIDGRPSPLSGDDLAAFLQSIQSNDIDNMEIITNPSAKYEAQGNAGIINIKLKKNKNLGMNGSVGLNAGRGVYQSVNGSVNLNYRNKKTNLFGNYTSGLNENESFLNARRTVPNMYFDQEGENYNESFDNNFKLGMDFFASKKSTFGVLITGFVSSGDQLNTNLTDIYAKEGTARLQVLDGRNIIDNTRDNINANINYRFDGGNGQTLNLDADYGVYDISSMSFQPNIYYADDEKTIIQENTFGQDQITDIGILSLKADYEIQKSWGTLSLGAKYVGVNTDNGFESLSFPDHVRENPVTNENLSNDFSYTENVTAVYTSYAYSKDKWSFQAGARVENTESEGVLSSSTQNDVNERSYLNLFPNVGVTYALNEKNTLRASYGKRLDRPNYQDLNPFEFRLNELAFFKGNPALKPQYTTNIQVGHTYNYSLNTTLSYSNTTDLMTRLTDTASMNQAFLTWENLSTQRVYNLNVSYPFSVSKNWSFYTSVSGTRTENRSNPGDSRFTEDKSINLNANIFNIFSQSTYRLPKGFSVELSGFYNSPGIWGGNFETQEYWNVDIGVQKKLMNDRATLSLGLSDVFKSQEWEARNLFGDLSIRANGGYDSRRVKLGFTYNFGSNEVKKARRRKTGLDDESKRAQSGGGLGG